MVSASSTTNCRERANSKIRSISLCTSADETKQKSQKHWFRAHNVHTICGEAFLPRLERVLDRSIMALLLGLLRTDLLANDISAVTRVIEILKNHLKIHKNVTKWSLITFSSAVVYCDLVWIPPPGLIIHYRAELIYLTGHQICAWGSQRALSASCLLPAYQRTLKYCQNCVILHHHMTTL